MTDAAAARRQRITREIDRPLTRAEVRAALESPIGDAEREQMRELVTWFTRRYPTPAERLAYVRRAYRRWTR